MTTDNRKERKGSEGGFGRGGESGQGNEESEREWVWCSGDSDNAMGENDFEYRVSEL